MKEKADEYRAALVEAVAESDDELMMKYLEGEELTEEEIIAGIRKATIACKMTPVCCGSSYKNKGVQPMLDAVIQFMPAPTDVPNIKGVNPETRRRRRTSVQRRSSVLRTGIQDCYRPVCW